MVGKNVLSEAEELIHGEREEEYGDAGELFADWARMFSAYVGVEVNGRDMCVAMVMLKMLRYRNSGYKHWDSLVDMAGYVGLFERIGR